MIHKLPTAVLYLLSAIVLLLLSGGCAVTEPPKVNPGIENPLLHPFASLENDVMVLQRIALFCTVIGWLLTFAEFGLRFTSFDLLEPFAPIFRWFAVLSTISYFALPFMPWGFVALGLGALALVIYELVKDHFNVKQAVTDLGSLIGVGGTTTATASTTTATATVIAPATPAIIRGIPATLHPITGVGYSHTDSGMPPAAPATPAPKL